VEAAAGAQGCGRCRTEAAAAHRRARHDNDVLCGDCSHGSHGVLNDAGLVLIYSPLPEKGPLHLGAWRGAAFPLQVALAVGLGCRRKDAPDTSIELQKKKKMKKQKNAKKKREQIKIDYRCLQVF
jgi:hypothetical protein